MITLKQPERSLHRALIERARGADPNNPQASCVAYSRLYGQLHPGFSGTFRGHGERRQFSIELAHVSWYEHEHGRPMLTALVVYKNVPEPADTFTQLARQLGRDVDDDQAFWQAELDEVIRFWATHDPVLDADGKFDRIMAELAAIKKLLR
jgi:hypothetical protein